MKTVLIVALLVCLVVAVVMLLVPGGPRITVIKRDEIDEREDRE